MRSSIIRSCALATVAAMGLAACAGHGVVPSSSSELAPMASNAGIAPLLTTCVKSPPQYEWIFKGACVGFMIKDTGGSFALGDYENITIKGSIGDNDAKGSVKIVLADAIDKNGDIESYKGKSFLAYKAQGTTIVYAAAINQSTQTIKPHAAKDKPVLTYVITDSKGLPGTECRAAVLAHQKNGTLKWSSLPGGPFGKKGDTVTITQSEAPAGFSLPPKVPLYLAVNCFS
jgi:hypothetical protein